jgi:hypothetical protein
MPPGKNWPERQGDKNAGSGGATNRGRNRLYYISRSDACGNRTICDYRKSIDTGNSNMNGKQERKARVAAKQFDSRFEDAYNRQEPRWVDLLQWLMPMHDMRKLFCKVIAKYRGKHAKDYQDYKKRSLKRLAHMARGTG